MTAARLYHHPGCSKSRAALALLRERGIDPEIVDYRAVAPSVPELQHLLDLLAVPAWELLRSGDEDARRLGLHEAAISQEAILAALAAHPHLLQRPIFVHRGRAVIARPPERVLELLGPAPG